jgi:spore germination protein GerM
MARRAAVVATLTAILFFTVVVFLAKRGLPASAGNTTATAATASPPVVPAAPGRKIKARLFYVADDGARLTSVERDVAYGDGVDAQAREIITAQIAQVAEPLVSAIPRGTTLRAVFITKSGDAYVDLSREARSAHPGGTVNELLTVYTIVNALTENLPAVTAVQLMVDGKEVDTLSGHVDLRRPLAKNLTWVQ